MMKIKAIGIIIVMMCGIALCGFHTSRYIRYDCEVIKVENGIVTVKDSTPAQYIWDFEIDSNELEKGDIINIKMYENNPDTIYDDEVYDYERQEDR